MKKKRKIRYVSVKLPVCNHAYPLDDFGCRKVPEYTPQYLKKHGRKLFDILLHKVPAALYSEVFRLYLDKEKKNGKA